MLLSGVMPIISKFCLAFIYLSKQEIARQSDLENVHTHEKRRKGRAKRDPLSSILRSLLRRVSNPHDRQAFRFRLLPEVQRDPVATEENNPRRRELIVQHLVVALERCRPPVRGPARVEARLRYPACPGPPSRNHLRPVLATLVAEEDLLVAVPLDPFANLVQRVEDHIDIGPVGGA